MKRKNDFQSIFEVRKKTKLRKQEHQGQFHEKAEEIDGPLACRSTNIVTQTRKIAASEGVHF